MKINQSRKSTKSIMANQGFGGVLLKEDGIELYIPANWIFKDGRLKKYAQKAWDKFKAEQMNERKVVM
jgi:hypothetical protein